MVEIILRGHHFTDFSWYVTRRGLIEGYPIHAKEFLRRIRNAEILIYFGD